MALFSQRKGIVPLNKIVQKESIDEDLRNKLWSALTIAIWDKWKPIDRYRSKTQETKDIELLTSRLWIHYFKQAIDMKPEFKKGYQNSCYEFLRDYFYNCKWNEIYDFLEFIIKNIPEDWVEPFKNIVNHFLETENSAYRFVDNEIVEITDRYEAEEIESAIEKTNSIVMEHLQRALNLLSDRKNPDYRNSIKESISAVEAISKLITKNKNSTLGDCIKIIKQTHSLHPAFEQALLKLYGYTNDSNGIRHSLTEEDQELSYADAKFMIVSCSAFVNYLWLKAAELKIKLK